MFLKISNLSEGVHNLNFNEPVSAANLDKPFKGNFNLDIVVQKSLNQIVLSAELTVDADFSCDRCTADYTSKLKNNYQMVYFFGEKPSDEEINTVYLASDADKIELSVDLRDYALLAIPMKKLCKENCKGLCVKCGRDLNESECNCSKEDTDSRWLPLMELKNKLNSN